MPKPSFMQAFLGKPSRSYADSSHSRVSEDVYYGHSHQHDPLPSYGYRTSLQLDQAGPSRRAYSTVSYAGPSRASGRPARPPSPTSTSEIGLSREPKNHRRKAALFDGAVPPLPPPPPHVHWNTPRTEWDHDEFEQGMLAPSAAPKNNPEHKAASQKRPSISRSRPDDVVTEQAPQSTSTARVRDPAQHVVPVKPSRVDQAPAPSSSHVGRAPLRDPGPIVGDHAHSPQSSLDSTPDTVLVSPQPSIVFNVNQRALSGATNGLQHNASTVSRAEVRTQPAYDSQMPNGASKIASYAIQNEPSSIPPLETSSKISPITLKQDSPVSGIESLAAMLSGTGPPVTKDPPPPRPASRAESIIEDDNASIYDVFYTPRSSMIIADSDEDDEAETPSANNAGLPIFHIQPPTPAPMGDSTETTDEPLAQNDGLLSPNKATRFQQEDSESDPEDEYDTDEDYSPDEEQQHIDQERWQQNSASPDARNGSQAVAAPLPAAPARRRVTLVEPEPEPDTESDSESESEAEADQIMPSRPAVRPANERPASSLQPIAPAQPSALERKSGQPKLAIKAKATAEDATSPPPRRKVKKKVTSADGNVRGASMTIVAGRSTPSPGIEQPLSRSGSQRGFPFPATEQTLSRSNSTRSTKIALFDDKRVSVRDLGPSGPMKDRTTSPLVTSTYMSLERPSSRASTSRALSPAPRTPAKKTDGASLTRSKSNKSVKSTRSTKSAKSTRSVKSTNTEKALPAVPPKASFEVDRTSSAFEHGRPVSGGSFATGSDMSTPSHSSIGVRAAGYGKGGWAAASAAPTVMYMPSGGDGWAAFQPLPPRSRATPLPGSSRSSSYDIDRSRSPTDSAASSILGLGASASIDGRMTFATAPGARSPSQLNGRSPGSSISGAMSITPPYITQSFDNSPSALDIQQTIQPTPSSPPASILEAEQGSNQGSPQLSAKGIADEDEDDVSSEDEERPSRSYSAAPVAQSDASYDYASEHPTSQATSQNSSPAKRLDVSTHAQRWVPPDYDPYAHGPPKRVNISPAYPNMPRSRASMPIMPRSASTSSRSSNQGSEHSQTTPRLLTSTQGSRVSFPGFPRPMSPDSQSLSPRPMSPAESFYSADGRPLSPSGSAPLPSFARSMSPPPALSPYEVAARAHAERMGLNRPSTLNPDLLTVLPEMSESDSNQLYLPGSRHKHRFSSSVSEAGGIRRSSSLWGKTKHAASDDGRHGHPSSESGRRLQSSISEAGRYAQSEIGDNKSVRSRISLDQPLRPKSAAGSSMGDMTQLLESHGRDEPVGGYTNLFLPQGSAYKPGDKRQAQAINARIVGLPQTAMAAITLSSALHTYLLRDDAPTPVHLRHTLPPPVDFTSHLKPPGDIARHQIMVNVYAVAVDWVDVAEVDRKEKYDVGKWIPGRSFVGRCLAVGVEEKEFLRGDLIMGLTPIKKSGALCEYMVVDRRHCARVDPATSLSVPELAALPSQGIAAHRAVREAMVSRGMQALIMDAHEGIPALMCQELTRKGIAVTAVVPGGAGHAEAQAACMKHGARGVLTGSPVNVLQSLEEGLFHLVVDTHGTAGVYEAAKRSLVDGGRLVSLANPKPPISPTAQPRSLRGFKGVFGSRAKDTKRIVYEYVHPAGAGEPEVDLAGLDYRDVLEEPILGVLHPPVNSLVPLERGAEVFRSKRMTDRTNVAVVRLVN